MNRINDYVKLVNQLTQSDENISFYDFLVQLSKFKSYVTSELVSIFKASENDFECDEVVVKNLFKYRDDFSIIFIGLEFLNFRFNETKKEVLYERNGYLSGYISKEDDRVSTGVESGEISPRKNVPFNIDSESFNRLLKLCEDYYEYFNRSNYTNCIKVDGPEGSLRINLVGYDIASVEEVDLSFQINKALPMALCINIDLYDFREDMSTFDIKKFKVDEGIIFRLPQIYEIEALKNIQISKELLPDFLKKYMNIEQKRKQLVKE